MSLCSLWSACHSVVSGLCVRLQSVVCVSGCKPCFVCRTLRRHRCHVLTCFIPYLDTLTTPAVLVAKQLHTKLYIDPILLAPVPAGIYEYMHMSQSMTPKCWSHWRTNVMEFPHIMTSVSMTLCVEFDTSQLHGRHGLYLSQLVMPSCRSLCFIRVVNVFQLVTSNRANPTVLLTDSGI